MKAAVRASVGLHDAASTVRKLKEDVIPPLTLFERDKAIGPVPLVRVDAHGVLRICDEGVMLLETLDEGAAAWVSGGDVNLPDLNRSGDRRVAATGLRRSTSTRHDNRGAAGAGAAAAAAGASSLPPTHAATSASADSADDRGPDCGRGNDESIRFHVAAIYGDRRTDRALFARTISRASYCPPTSGGSGSRSKAASRSAEVEASASSPGPSSRAAAAAAATRPTAAAGDRCAVPPSVVTEALGMRGGALDAAGARAALPRLMKSNSIGAGTDENSGSEEGGVRLWVTFLDARFVEWLARTTSTGPHGGGSNPDPATTSGATGGGVPVGAPGAAKERGRSSTDGKRNPVRVLLTFEVVPPPTPEDDHWGIISAATGGSGCGAGSSSATTGDDRGGITSPGKRKHRVDLLVATKQLWLLTCILCDSPVLCFGASSLHNTLRSAIRAATATTVGDTLGNDNDDDEGGAQKQTPHYRLDSSSAFNRSSSSTQEAAAEEAASRRRRGGRRGEITGDRRVAQTRFKEFACGQIEAMVGALSGPLPRPAALCDAPLTTRPAASGVSQSDDYRDSDRQFDTTTQHHQVEGADTRRYPHVDDMKGITTNARIGVSVVPSPLAAHVFISVPVRAIERASVRLK
eukprot:GHVU01071098.1.p1 GENE.GHVU01071098.1~~GHVU01071098.1.p1  ORF type:complete len:634 (+),score=78.49 GHVU01071098.1:147-2048(+)